MSRYLFEYDHSYYPPAPVIEITIDGYQPRLGQVRRQALVDTGADWTMIGYNANNRNERLKTIMESPPEQTKCLISRGGST